MNPRWLIVSLVCLVALPASCRDFADGSEAGVSGRGGTNESGANPGGAGGDGPGGSTGGGRPEGVGGTAGALPAPGDAGSTAGPEGGRPPVAGGAGAVAVAGEAGAQDQSAGGAGGVPGVFSPGDLAGLVLWLTASSTDCTSVDGRVSRWVDASGFGNDAKPEIGGPPAPQFIGGEANGHGVVRFTPSESQDSAYSPERLVLADSESLHFADEDLVLLLVGRYSNIAEPVVVSGSVLYNGAGAFAAKQEPSYPYRGINIMAGYPGPFSEASALTRLVVQSEVGGAIAFSYSDHLNDGKVRLYGVRRSGTDLAIFIDGTREGGARLAAGTDWSSVGAALVLGGQSVQPLHGDIAEMVIVRGALADSRFDGLQRYLLQKYAIE